MKTYTVARTVVYYFEVDAENEQEALDEVVGLGIGAATIEELTREEVIYAEKLA